MAPHGAARLCAGIGLGLALTLGSAGARAAVDTGHRQVELATNGKFDQLEQMLEEQARQHPLRTRDQHALCYAYSKTKRYDRLPRCLEHLERLVAAGDRRTRLFGLEDATASIQLMRAEMGMETGQFDQAAVQARECLATLRRQRSDAVDLVIQCMAAEAMALSFRGARQDAQRKAQELAALKVRGFLVDYTAPWSIAMGRVYMALGQYDKALEAIQRDRTFRLRSFLDNLVSGAFLRGLSNWVWSELPRYFMITKALLETGQVDEARKGLDDLLAIEQVQSNGEIHWQILHERARLAHQDGRTDAAIEFFKRSVDVIEQQRLRINSEASKIGFIGDKQGVYGQLIDVLSQAQRVEEAFAYTERAKARALIEMLAAREQTTSIIAASRQEAAPLLAEYNAAREEAFAQVTRNVRSGAASMAPAALRVTQPAALAAVQPELASLVSVVTVPLEEIRARLHADEVIVQFYGHQDRLYAWVISATEARMTELSGRHLDAQVRRFRLAINSQSPTATEEAQALYQRLLQPLEGLIRGRSMLIIPHGPLHYLPFAALHNGHSYLIEHQAIRYLPSASVVRFLQDRPASGQPKALIVGNPDLGDPQQDLPHAEREARALAAMLPGSQLRLREQATEASFKQEAPKFDILHIASHGEFNPIRAVQSRLKLRTGGPDDGSLTVEEVYGLRLNADLVTLSACETGVGDVRKGDDVLGLLRGFLYAGSRNIVASHWAVEDEATSVLMSRFYERTLKGMPKRQALREAQLETQKRFSHPFYWAAFYLTGTGV